ncbi:conserved hypothetical protein [Pseudovibrio sp. JE062]|nr:conserved hypothetical protein [Pseudovibrio sp. JE062]
MVSEARSILCKDMQIYEHSGGFNSLKPEATPSFENEKQMAKAYWVSRINIKDPETYRFYTEAAPSILRKYGGTILARGEKAEQMEGEKHHRHVIAEFESMDAAMTCYNSPEYRVARDFRRGIADVETVIVEGLD